MADRSRKRRWPAEQIRSISHRGGLGGRLEGGAVGARLPCRHPREVPDSRAQESEVGPASVGVIVTTDVTKDAFPGARRPQRSCNPAAAPASVHDAGVPDSSGNLPQSHGSSTARGPTVLPETFEREDGHGLAHRLRIGLEQGAPGDQLLALTRSALSAHRSSDVISAFRAWLYAQVRYRTADPKATDLDWLRAETDRLWATYEDALEAERRVAYR